MTSPRSGFRRTAIASWALAGIGAAGVAGASSLAYADTLKPVELPAAVQSEAPPAPSQEEQPVLQKLQFVRAQINALLVQAARDRDPELYAAVMLDNLPDFITEDEILERFSAPDAIDTLIGLDSRVGQYRQWFEEFRRAVIAGFDTEEGETAPGPDDGPIDGELA